MSHPTSAISSIVTPAWCALAERPRSSFFALAGFVQLSRISRSRFVVYEPLRPPDRLLDHRVRSRAPSASPAGKRLIWTPSIVSTSGAANWPTRLCSCAAFFDFTTSLRNIPLHRFPIPDLITHNPIPDPPVAVLRNGVGARRSLSCSSVGFDWPGWREGFFEDWQSSDIELYYPRPRFSPLTAFAARAPTPERGWGLLLHVNMFPLCSSTIGKRMEGHRWPGAGSAFGRRSRKGGMARSSAS